MSENSPDNSPLKHESSAVHEHLKLYQSIIARMSSNSASSKQWCIGLISAIFVLVAKEGQVEFALLALFPLILFAFLDSYYLAMERKFIDANNVFLDKLQDQQAFKQDLFRVKLERGQLPTAMWSAFCSPAVCPFYIGLLLLLSVAKYISACGLG